MLTLSVIILVYRSICSHLLRLGIHVCVCLLLQNIIRCKYTMYHMEQYKIKQRYVVDFHIELWTELYMHSRPRPQALENYRCFREFDMRRRSPTVRHRPCVIVSLLIWHHTKAQTHTSPGVHIISLHAWSIVVDKIIGIGWREMGDELEVPLRICDWTGALDR